jgi:subtilase family serine protease
MRLVLHGYRRPASFLIAVILALSFTAVLPVLSTGASSTDAQPSQPIAGYKLVGEAPKDLPVLVTVAIPFRNPDLLTSMAKQVSDPSSPMFGHFLTPGQIAQYFLPTAAYDSMLTRLHALGLPVVFTALDSTIVVRATVSQIKEYLNAGVDLYSNGTRSYYMANGPSTFEGAHFYASNLTSLVVRPKLASLSAGQPQGNVTFTAQSMSAKLLPAVYNATSLYAKGFQGKGETIGLLDFFGSPTVSQDLKTFDKKFGFPDTNFTLKPIGPYAPNLGASFTWNVEIALDAEVSHAMAPEASIIMYVANNALSFDSILGPIVAADEVGTLSQSFSFFLGEWQVSQLGGAAYYFNVYRADQLFQMGSLEGITFIASSGDAGGAGYSSGPAGNLNYPDDSPFVTSAGGSQSYVYTLPNGTEKFAQTAWSNQVYVPNGVNAGGGGGGVSFLMPKPWYQQSQTTPASYPNGRMEPDLSLQGGVDPATYIVSSGSVFGEGGTSESAPLLAGLLALVAQSTGRHLGQINPFLYSLGNNPATYAKVFYPITFGYIIPWTSSSGYNLATGWGAPNIGELAHFYQTMAGAAGLDVSVVVTNSTGASVAEFTQGQKMLVAATVTSGTTIVTTGSFTASLETLGGSSLATPMTFDGAQSEWVATLTMGSEAGPAYVSVAGSSGGQSGGGIADTFAGYLAAFASPLATNPWTTVGGLAVSLTVGDLSGNTAPSQALSMQIQSYSILANTYATIDTVGLTPPGSAYTATLDSMYPTGDMNLMLTGDTYGFVPFVNGIALQTSLMFPEVAAEPGSVAPGQSLFIIASPVAPLNIGGTFSFEDGTNLAFDVQHGSNITAMLVNPAGTVVSTGDVIIQSCLQALRACNGGQALYNGYLPVPSSATPGLYTILLRANYSSLTTSVNFGVNTINGSFYGQVEVTGGPIAPTITISPSTLYEGQTATLTADIHYANGQEVTFGEYTAVVYPQELQDQYTTIMHSEYANSQLISLSYSPTLNRWVSNFTLPSPYAAGVISPINGNSFFYSGPYDAYVTGLSFDGVPTTSASSAQKGFFIQPYVYISGQNIQTLPQVSGLAFSGDAISGPASLSGDVFLGTNTIQGGAVTITSSEIHGTLVVNNAQVTLAGVTGGDISATGSTLVLLDSAVGALQLTRSTVSLASSSYQSITPSVPAIALQQPTANTAYRGTLAVSASVTGDQVSSVSFSVDGVAPTVVQNPATGGVYGYSLDTTQLSDGVHTMTVTASQADGMSASVTAYFSTDNKLASASGQINNLGSQLSVQNSTLGVQRSTINTLKSDLQSANGKVSDQASTISTLTNELYVLAAIAVVALVLSVVSLLRRGGRVDKKMGTMPDAAAPPPSVSTIPREATHEADLPAGAS